MKYIDAFLKEFERTPLFTLGDVKRFLRYKGSTNLYAKVFISKMIASGRVYKISKGNYSLYDDIETVGFPFYPFYYGLGFALTYHNLWRQQSNPHIITTRKVRVGVRTAFGLNFQVSMISKDMFFGYVYVRGKNFYYPVSDVEKTLIDTLYYGVFLEDYVYKNIFQKLDKDKIKTYLKRCNERVNAAYLKIQ